MLTQESKVLLEKVAVAIEEEPKRIHMDNWILLEDEDANVAESENLEFPPCGTIGCVAGMVVLISIGDRSKIREIRAFDNMAFLSNKIKSPERTVDKAREILALDDDQSGRLFLVDCWPGKFREWSCGFPTERIRGNPPNQSPEYASVVAERIRFFIATDGTDDEVKP